jgi:ornithine cyclodeaminase/alanine dehydrogenase-like protein (mu-crystallin family)
VVHLLTSGDVTDLLDLRQAMAVLEGAFLEQGKGSVVPWPPSMMTSGGGKLIMRSGGLAEQGRYGVRVTSGPEHPSFALIYDSPTGVLLSIMTYPFSDLRLAASVALGAARLTKPTIERVAMLGSGRNALSLLQAVRAVRPFTSVQVYSRQEQNRTQFAERAAPALEVPVEPTMRPEDAVDGADLVIVATSARTAPALNGDWLAPDADVISIGARYELDESVYERAARVITTSKVQELTIHEYSEDWPIVRATRSGSFRLDDIVELGTLLSNPVPRPSGITLFRDAQGGFTDIALAAWAYDQARALSRGTEWSPE